MAAYDKDLVVDTKFDMLITKNESPILLSILMQQMLNGIVNKAQ